MSIKNLRHRKKKENHLQKPQTENDFQSMRHEELYQLAIEMTRVYEMLPIGGFPDGIWHFY